MTNIQKISFFAVVILSTVVFVACDENNQSQVSHPPEIVSMKISQPEVNPKKSTSKTPEKKIPAVKKKEENTAVPAEQQVSQNQTETEEIAEHYDAKGKIDPFKSLMEEEQATQTPEKQAGPPRILTPLEKIDLSQIKLVAVIEMKNKRIAMVEEASGKGYEVGVGTYIGKNGGKITQIKSSSIIVKELVRNFRGKLSEREQEIRIHKNDIGE